MGLTALLLFNVQDLIAFRACVIDVFEKLHEERNQTAAQNKPGNEEDGQVGFDNVHKF